MKKYRFSFFLIVAIFLLGWTACDKIDEPLEIVSVQDIPENIDDTLFFSDSVMVTQKQVLLEDFTGHLCVNCPEAGLAAHQWSENFDHRLIIYGIHSGFQASPLNSGLYTADFTCPTGDELFSYFNIQVNPSAPIDRVEYNGNLILYYITGDWEAAVNIEMAKDNVIDMKVKNTYYPNLKSVLINVSSTFLQPFDGKYKIVVYIVEDHIIAPQKNNKPEIGPEPDWVDYDHRNILRDAVNGTFGNYITGDGTVTAGETYLNDFYYNINAEWLTDSTDMNIITYVYKEESGEVLQVAELEIKMKE